MRFETKERAKERRRVRQERIDFLAEFTWCWFCENAPAECVHEMACGSHRAQAVLVRFTWGAACVDCNEHQLTDYSVWPLAAQLASKWINDRVHYDRVAFNRLRGRADNAISQAEVIVEVCRILDAERKWRV
jgi:hypothetical protein